MTAELFRNTIPARLSSKAAGMVRKGYPWVYTDAITLRREGTAGDLVALFDHHNKFTGLGLYDDASDLCVRVLSTTQVSMDVSWLRTRMNSALELRKPLFDSSSAPSPTSGFRLLHGENDKIPGLVVDRYEDSLVMRLDTVAWVAHLDVLIEQLESLLQLRGINVQQIVLRLSRNTQAALDSNSGGKSAAYHDGQWLKGEAGTIFFSENGLQFIVRPDRGQKTGFFLDQRDNRSRVETLVRKQKLSTVLNTFAYSGGFSLYASRGGATYVHSLDQSAPALKDAVRNFELNQSIGHISRCDHKTIEGDVFSVLTNYIKTGKKFDLVILDPPAFAQKKADRDSALHAYTRLIQSGAQVTSKGGYLVAASCSSRISAREFSVCADKGISKAARSAQLMEECQHAIDHPIGYEQGAYLKCRYYRLS